MDLISITTSYLALSKKYENFRAPTVEVTVGGTKLVSGSNISIEEVSVDLTSGTEASGCSFTVSGAYVHKNTNFSSKVGKIQIGETVQIDLGYIRLETVFKGYINGITYEFGDGGLNIRVEGMDAKGLLMKTKRKEFLKESSSDAVVNKFLGAQPVSSYLDGKEVDGCPKEGINLQLSDTSDYDVIVEQAQKHQFEFFILQGKVFFRKKEKNTSSIMTLSPKHGILNATIKLDGSQLYKTAEVRSMEEGSEKGIKGEANISGTFSETGSATKFMGPSRQIFTEPDLKETGKAKQKAQEKLDVATESFASLECTCVGMPEIGPGRFIEINELSGTVNKKYYITKVTHNMGADGYKTNFSARMKSL